MDSDVHYSVVGPGHNRAYLSLIAMAGYSAVNRTDKHPHYAPPFTIYTMSGLSFDQHYKTEASAKRAVRKLINKWLLDFPASVTWSAEDTGVHWTAKASGLQVGSYYYCPEASQRHHKGFKVYFGGTYYITEFKDVEGAKSAVNSSYQIWLAHVKKCLLTDTKSEMVARGMEVE